VGGQELNTMRQSTAPDNASTVVGGLRGGIARRPGEVPSSAVGREYPAKSEGPPLPGGGSGLVMGCGKSGKPKG